MKQLFFTLLVLIISGTHVFASDPNYKKAPRSVMGEYDPQNGIGAQVSFLYLSNTKSFARGIGLTLVRQMGDHSDIYSGVDVYAPLTYTTTAVATHNGFSYNNKTIDVPVTYNVERITKYFIGGYYYLNGEYETEKRIYLMFAFSPFIISGTTEIGAYDEYNYSMELIQRSISTGGFTINGGIGAKIKLGKWNWCTDVQYNHNLFAKTPPVFSPQYFVRLQTGLWYPF